MNKAEIPILEFDGAPEAILEPANVIEPMDVPARKSGATCLTWRQRQPLNYSF